MTKKDKKDVFHAWMTDGAEYDGTWEMPKIPAADVIPSKLISFDKAMSKKNGNFEGWVHFYIDDYKFERLWNNPNAYLERLGKYDGVIFPYFSLFRYFPLAMQIWNTYRNRTIGYWFYKNGVPVIANVRWGDERSYEFCFSGVVYGSIVAVGSHGCIKKADDKKYFIRGLKEMIARLRPKTILVYGRVPDDLFAPCKENGIPMKQFTSSFHEAHHKEMV